MALGVAGDAKAEQPRIAFAPQPALLRVLGARAATLSPMSLDRNAVPDPGTRRLSAAGSDYLARLATMRHDTSTIRGDTDYSERVRRFLAEQIRGLGSIVFFTRHPLDRPNVAGSVISQSEPLLWGCSIQAIEPASGPASARTIFADPNGCILDMSVSLDASTLFFSFRRRDEPCWQIYEINVDGTGCRRLSDDRNRHDISPVELPSGDLIFVSTRAGGQLVSEPGVRSNLWIMRRDGKDAHRVSQNTLSDLSPRLLADGRIAFTRWEYVDRDVEYRQGIWTQHPDGAQFQLFFGNTIRDVGIFWQAWPVPGHDDVLIATFAPPTGWPEGAIGLVTNRYGPEAARDVGFAWLTDETTPLGDRTKQADGMSYHDMDDGRLLTMALRDPQFRPAGTPDDLSRANELEARARSWLDAQRPAYRDPFPASDYLFLASYREAASPRFDLCLLDLCGNRVELHADPTRSCCGAMLLRPRASFEVSGGVEENRRPHGEQPSPPWGTALVVDVYQGLPASTRGRAKYIQVMEQLPKTEGGNRRAYDQTSVIGYGTYYAKRCWGRVPIESDGSAHFELPPLREVYLQVLDAEGRELQRQTSSLQIMSGEKRSCIGCHEPRHLAPIASSAMPLAARRPPTRLVMPTWTRDGLVEFERVVQPVLDRYCADCHCGAVPEAGCDLSSDKTRFFNMAYDNLLGRSRSYRQHNLVTGKMLSQEAARGNPLVHFFWLRRAPTGTNSPLESGSWVSRIWEYLDVGHCQQEVTPEDRQRIYLWIDANVPFFGDETPPWPLAPGGRDRCTDVRTGEAATWFTEGFLEVYNRRCVGCHDCFPDPNDHESIWDGRMAWLNLTHPQWSPALTAHLSRSAGGRGIPTERFVEDAELFADTRDPDYVRLLAALRRGASETQQVEATDRDD